MLNMDTIIQWVVSQFCVVRMSF
ncbi:hypothetical protein Ahy_A02g008423 isoform A [Arachis hypogaea]|uniref:Uncharacterized protein n=1 Tax=Arachis hypogaea TaxID=3818 RepID=A0A445EED1_ARAHY|nr:hypothetical protein Ahy_A02g008423 isoform A [Arachis hypogaea]